jgi:hypothetical protein
MANATQFMLPNVLTKFILPNWLVPEEPGMNCRSHPKIFTMFLVYNLVSVLVSLLLAWPFFVGLQAAAQTSLFRAFSNAYRRLRGASGTQETKRQERQEYRDTKLLSFFMVTAGSIIISISAPIFSGLSIYLRHRGTVNFSNLLAEWSTRPRGTFLVLFTNF